MTTEAQNDTSATYPELPHVNGQFPSPATNLRDYLTDAIVTYERYDHEASDYDHDFDEAATRNAAAELLDEIIRVHAADRQTPQAAARPLATGARIRIDIEATVESLGDHELTLTGGTHIGYQNVEALRLTVLDSGWVPGDTVDDGHGPMVRVRREDGIEHWLRIADERAVYDDETSLASLSVISRGPAPDGEAS